MRKNERVKGARDIQINLSDPEIETRIAEICEKESENEKSEREKKEN